MSLDAKKLSLGFPTKRDSNQSPKLQRLANVLYQDKAILCWPIQ